MLLVNTIGDRIVNIDRVQTQVDFFTFPYKFVEKSNNVQVEIKRILYCTIVDLDSYQHVDFRFEFTINKHRSWYWYNYFPSEMMYIQDSERPIEQDESSLAEKFKKTTKMFKRKNKTNR